MTKGVAEWANHSINCISGCSHNCRYCYAKRIARRFNRILSDVEWEQMFEKFEYLTKRFKKREGRIMFPTAHDITPEHLSINLIVLRNLLQAGNEVLITTKPHKICICKICDELWPYRDQIQFRFTITSDQNKILQYWEPGAPSFEERLEALMIAFKANFRTSVSIEPYLSDPISIIQKILPYITESIWIGSMNRHCVQKDDYQKVAYLYNSQILQSLVELYRDHPVIRFKDSIQNQLNIDLKGREIKIELN